MIGRNRAKMSIASATDRQSIVMKVIRFKFMVANSPNENKLGNR
jgi:hypothetical protein